MTSGTFKRPDNPRVGILFILLGMVAISVNDMLIKHLSGDYPLHQMVFVRSAIGIVFSLIFLQFEGGFSLLRTRRPWLHLLRCLCMVGANMAFFAALAVLPLANVTALFFVAPLFITLLSIPLLGEKVGPRRLGAVAVGFLGVVVMMHPTIRDAGTASDRAVVFLPIFAALAYAVLQILTRRLGVASKASAMAVYLQGSFIVVSLVFWAVAGDGRFTTGVDNESLLFLLRAWTWPASDDWWLFLMLGLASAVIGYSLAQAYRSANAAVIAPFEYIALPLAIFWGWVAFGELPNFWALSGIALIAVSGVYVFVRERKQDLHVASGRPVRRV